MSTGSYLRLARVSNSLMAGGGALLGEICLPQPHSAPVIAAEFFCLALLAAAGNIQNDLGDIRTDRWNEKDRPLASGEISPRVAFWLSMGGYGLGCLLAALLGLPQFLLATLITALLCTYNLFWKRVALLGNIDVAFLCALAIYFPEWPSPPFATLFPVLFALLATLAREIVKDIEDIQGDRRSLMRTLPIVAGVAPARNLTLFLLALIFGFLPLPAWAGHYHYLYALLLPLVLWPWAKAIQALIKGDWQAAQKALKLMMAGGMLAIAGGQL